MQVEDLTRKSRLLKVELERTSRQLKETSAIAQQEAEKNKASQEVIRSLTAQVREIIVVSILDCHYELTIFSTEDNNRLCVLAKIKQTM